MRSLSERGMTVAYGQEPDYRMLTARSGDGSLSYVDASLNKGRVERFCKAVGIVTRIGMGSQSPGWWAPSGRSGRNLPGMRRLGPEGPKGAAGDEVAL